MTYTELKDAISLYSENFEVGFMDSVDGFIRAAEQRIYHLAKLPVANKTAPINTVGGTRTLPLPEGFLAVNEIEVTTPMGRTTALLSKEVSFLREAYPDADDVGVPQFYAQKNDNTLLLAPTPASTYLVELEYFGLPDSIVTAGTTWLGDNFDQCLLYGALVEAAVFDKQMPDQIGVYKERFETQMANLFALVGRRNNTDFYRAGRDNA